MPRSMCAPESGKLRDGNPADNVLLIAYAVSGYRKYYSNAKEEDNVRVSPPRMNRLS